MTQDRRIVFTAAGLRAVELQDDDEARLQRFFEQNPGYFQAVGGQPPQPGEAHEEIHGPLPAGWSFTRKWLLGLDDADGEMRGMANVVADLLAPHVWHVGLFIIATSLHGRGVARSAYRALEQWMQDNGAQWARLGVVEGNARAERFWESAGFVEMRKREGVEIGTRVVTRRVMAKALAGGDLAHYLTLVPRDRPE
jgi:RimJ/RimL family protein N-acetyltransferase